MPDITGRWYDSTDPKPGEMELPGIGTIQAIQCTFIQQKIARERPYPFQDSQEREKHGQAQFNPMATGCKEATEGVCHTLSNFEKATASILFPSYTRHSYILFFFSRDR